MSDSFSIGSLRAFILDMDGVIYRGEAAIPGAVDFVTELRRRRVPFLFVTNNSTAPPARVAHRLAALGIEAQARDILTSAEATASLLAELRPRCRAFVIGEDGIRQALLSAGFLLTETHVGAEAVVVGLDRGFSYQRLQEASLAVQAGALLLATNADHALPTPDGLLPGAGAMLAAIEVAADAQAIVVGKPSPRLFRHALARLGTLPEVTACVGDRAETDILAGQQAGLRTIGVLSGVSTRADFDSLPVSPDAILADLAALGAAYFGPVAAL